MKICWDEKNELHLWKSQIMSSVCIVVLIDWILRNKGIIYILKDEEFFFFILETGGKDKRIE